MICATCAAENQPGAKFCNECGSPLAAGCPNCGATNKPGAKFCNECGTPLGGAAQNGQPSSAPAAGSAAPVAERKLVTVLFADMVGFTPFAEERDAEEVRDTLSRYFELCAEIIGRYGGTVEKYIGDAVMAVWGAPVAHEDDAERAVRAALDLVGRVSTLGPDLQARAGVLSGEAAVTLGATNQGLVAGDLVNTAARLQSVAEPGSVLVGETTMRASSNAIVYEEAGEQSLKGKQAPVPAWRAMRVIAEVGGRNRSDVLEAPFVGRVDELRLLEDLFHATGREGKIRLVSVMGPAGIGKSRLAWEFLKYVDGLVETTYWHSGRSPAYGEGISFWALGEMVRERCGLAEQDDETTTRAKVAETVAHWVPDEQEQAWIAPALLTLLGFGSGIASDELFAAWRTFFERISAQGTVTLVFEDMHFADSGLLDFIEHMLEWSRGMPIYIVTLARPDLLDRRPGWGAGKRSFTSIYLEPLADGQMRELLDGLVPGLPETAVNAIVERADGIPLYAVETVRMLVADGRLVQRDGTYQPSGNLESLSVPDTLTALIASRLDALEPVDRALMHDAAVLGQTFTAAALGAVSGMAEAELEERVNGLIRRELFTRQLDVRSAERGQLAFMQALLREVAYNTLAKRDRKVRHLAAARHFEQIGSDELAGVLANHYAAAHANAPEGPEADALAAQARIALSAAAERASELAAHDQAIAFLEQAVSVAGSPAERADLLERAGKSARTLSRMDRAVDLFNQAVAESQAAGDRVGAARATAELGETLLNARRDTEGVEVLESALRDFGDVESDRVIADTKRLLARGLAELESDDARAATLYEEALLVAEHGNYRDILATALIGKGSLLARQGRLREAIGLIRTGEEIAREQSNNELVLAALVVGGYVLGEIDNEAALSSYRDGLELARRIGHRGFEGQFVNNIGYTSFLTGDWDFALSEMDGALDMELDIASRVWLLSNALCIRVSRGDDVDKQLAELDSLAAENPERRIRIAPLDSHANAAQAAGRLEDARSAWEEIADLDRSQGPAAYYQAARPMLWAAKLAEVRRLAAAVDATGYHGPVVEVRRVTLAAYVDALEGRSQQALARFKQALEGWRALRLEWEVALTGLDAVTALDPALSEVRQIATSTREILERLNARPYVELLDRAAQRHAPSPAPADTAANLVADSA